MSDRLSNRLAEHSASRTVTLLANKQVELCWDQVALAMQMTDLLVLNQTVRAWMDIVEREWVEIYRLTLNDCVLFIHSDDVCGFCAMVQAAAEQLPRRTVRWADVTVRLAPYTVDQEAMMGCFSSN